jgi:hypothetical protein
VQSIAGFFILLVWAGACHAESRLDVCTQILNAVEEESSQSGNLSQENRLLKLGYEVLRPSRKIIGVDPRKETYKEMVIRRFGYEDILTEVITTEDREGRVSEKKKQQSQAGLEEYFSRIDTLVDFAIAQNSLRDHYNKKLYQAMEKIGDRFWSQFEYVSTYRRAPSGKKGELLGTWRLDSAPYETVKYPTNFLLGPKGKELGSQVIHQNKPEERNRPEYITQAEWYLSKPGGRIRFQRPAVYAPRTVKQGKKDIVIEEGRGKIAEISALAMRERSGLENNILVMSHLVAATIDPKESFEYNMNGKFFYGTVDDPEFVAKRGLTRQKYWKETPEGWILTDEGIEKDGMKFYIVGGSLKDIVGMVANIRKGYDKLTDKQEAQVRQLLRSLLSIR